MIHPQQFLAVTIAAAVAKQARADGLCAPFDDAALPAMISAKMWEPALSPLPAQAIGLAGQGQSRESVPDSAKRESKR